MPKYLVFKTVHSMGAYKLSTVYQPAKYLVFKTVHSMGAYKLSTVYHPVYQHPRLTRQNFKES